MTKNDKHTPFWKGACQKQKRKSACGRLKAGEARGLGLPNHINYQLILINMPFILNSGGVLQGKIPVIYLYLYIYTYIYIPIYIYTYIYTYIDCLSIADRYGPAAPHVRGPRGRPSEGPGGPSAGAPQRGPSERAQHNAECISVYIHIYIYIYICTHTHVSLSSCINT